jgi:hypothetical protein
MRRLETQQKYDFDIEYYLWAKDYIQDALSHQVDHKNPLLPQVGRKTVEEAINNGTVNAVYTEALLSSEIQPNGWLDHIRVAHRQYLYFEDVLIELKGKDPPEAESNTKLLARRKRARQLVLEDRLIRQAATGKLGVPGELQQ